MTSQLIKIARTLGFVAVLSFLSLAQAERYIVVLKNKSAFAQINKQIAMSPDSSLSQVAALQASDVYVERSLENLSSLVVQAETEAQVAALTKNPAVAFVEQEKFYASPRPMEGFRLTQAWDFDLSYSVPMRMIGTGSKAPWGIEVVKAPQAWSQTQGQNARVLILDTGIDRDHPAVKGNIEDTKDFVHDSNSPYEAADHVGHGTHVAGTVAALRSATGFTGVAPQARILAGRVCDTTGCSNISVAEGIDWGVSKKVDLISMSLGGAFGSLAEKMAVERAEQAGVTIVAASGNDGTAKVSFPAAFPSVIAVGAIDTTMLKAEFSQWGPELDVVAPGVGVLSSVPVGSGRESVVQVTLDGLMKEVNSNSFVGALQASSPIRNTLVYAGLGKPEEFAKVVVKGKFALVQRGEIKFADKVQNALASGAAGVVIYNNAPGLIQGSLTDDGSELSIPVVMIEQSVGDKLAKAVSTGSTIEAEIKTIATDYASFSGTSMATPHVSGVVALMKSVNKKLTTSQVRDILKATARPLTPNDQNQFGAGLVDAEKAVKAAIMAR